MADHLEAYYHRAPADPLNFNARLLGDFNFAAPGSSRVSVHDPGTPLELLPVGLDLIPGKWQKVFEHGETHE